MHDHGRNWTEIPDWSRAIIEADGVSLRTAGGLDQHLVSGDLAGFGRDSGLDPQGAGALGLVSGAAYTVRLGRDRLLAVGPLPDAVRPGWNAQGFAVTEVSAAWHVFELDGPGAMALVARATTLDPRVPGPCAALGFAGVQAVLYRHGEARLRLHLDRALAPYLWSWLEAALDVMGDVNDRIAAG